MEIKELYTMRASEEERALAGRADAYCKELKEILNEKGCALLEGFEECLFQMSASESEAAFVKGFSVGARLIREALCDD